MKTNMKNYIFLVKGIEGLSGGPRYVNNKCRFLKEKGWNVYVFWSFDIAPVVLDQLKPFDNKKFIVHELQFYPCWFTTNQQDAIIERIVKQVETRGTIVVESNKLQLGAWGEMLAHRLNAKHINFVTTERIQIHNKGTFDFCYAKLKRNEFFTINAPAVNHLFSNYISFENPEDYYWSAMQEVEVKEYSFPSFDNLPNADYTITHFGRTKSYLPYVLEQLKEFVEQHPRLKFNLFFLGEMYGVEEIYNCFSNDNVQIAFHPAVKVIPLQVLKKSDIIIATAGCAILASVYGGKVISMDVNRKVPLGFLDHTTKDCNTYSGLYDNNKSLYEWLDSLLIKKEVFKQLEDHSISHGLDYQMSFVKPSDGVYLNPSKVREDITKYDRLLMLITKIGLFGIVDFLFFARKKRLLKNNRH